MKCRASIYDPYRACARARSGWASEKHRVAIYNVSNRKTHDERTIFFRCTGA